MRRLTVDQLAEYEDAGAEIERPDQPASEPVVEEPAPEPAAAPEPPAADFQMASMQASMQEHIKATNILIAQSTESTRQLIESLKDKPPRGDFEFIIQRDESVKGEYKPIERVLVRAVEG